MHCSFQVLHSWEAPHGHLPTTSSFCIGPKEKRVRQLPFGVIHQYRGRLVMRQSIFDFTQIGTNIGPCENFVDL